MTDERPGIAADAATSAELQAAAGDTPPKKNRTWIWILAAVLVLALAAAAYAASQSSGGGWLFFLRGGATVPQIVGLSQQEAETAIAGASLKVGTVSEAATLAVAPGTVVAQSPEASTKVQNDSAVDMTVSVVPDTEVPDVTGKTESDASATLAEQGLVVGNTSYVSDSQVKAGLVKSQEPAAGTQARVGASVALTVSKGPQTGQVPNVIGSGEAAAKATLEDAGFKVTTAKAANADVPAGTVASQSPAAGTIVTAGSTVTITVSSGPPPPQNPTVPNVVGLSESDATSKLQSAGFKVATSEASNADVPSGDVISQSPAGGTGVAAGSTVTITVSSGPAADAKPTVPDVVGLSEDDAKSTLEGTGFKTTTTKAENAKVPAGDVSAQSPAAGTVQAAGSTVALTVSAGAPAAERPAVPDVVGMGVLEAIRALRDAGLKFSIVFVPATENYLKVASQDPAAGEQVDPGSSVELGIGLPSFLFGSEETPPSTPETGSPTPQPTPTATAPSQPSAPPSSSATTP